MYIIRSGVISLYDGDSFIKDLKRGDFFGEMVLLAVSRRNATASVSLDATLYCLKTEDFNKLLEKNKSIGLFLSRHYARRLTGKDKEEKKETRSVLYTASATDKNLGLSHFLYSMCYHITTESAKRVLVVEPHLEVAKIMERMGLKIISCPNTSLFGLLPENIYKPEDFHWFRHGSGFIVLQIDKGFSEHLTESLPHLLEGVKNNYDLVFFSLSHLFNAFDDQLIRLCDKNLLLINNTEQALPKVKNKVFEIEKKAGPEFDRVRVGVSHLEGTQGLHRQFLKNNLNLAEIPQIWVDRSDKAFQDKIDTKKHFPIRGARALAREIAGVRIGLALGAGAARGWAHRSLKGIGRRRYPY